MPRKSQFTPEDVTISALESVRENGWSGLSAPAIAKKMGCSTMPIYSYFKNMQALEDEIIKEIWEMVMAYQKKKFTGDVWVDQAIGWIKFSRKENNLFQCMLNGRNRDLQYDVRRKHWNFLTTILNNYSAFKDLDVFLVERIRYSHVMLTHGIAMSDNIGLTSILFESDEILFQYMSSTCQSLLLGYQKVPSAGEHLKRLVNEKKKEIINRQP
ncbi:MAG: TetR/AcrR family transcriptional regulator [Desulfobacteraceae bacterium]|nr:TetR/AcrR family transcriptional regulator [Desulfobacteraceae bacterium]